MNTLRLGALVSALAVLAACSSHDPAVAEGDPTPSTTISADDVAEGSATTHIRLIVAGRPVAAHLEDNPTARALMDRLPLTLSFRDLNRVEKIAKLPAPLTTEGVPEGADPEVADIGYYAPTGDVVLYYGDVGYWNGIVRIGRFDGAELAFIESQSDGFDTTIERA